MSGPRSKVLIISPLHCGKNVDWVSLLSCSLAFCIYLNTLNAGFVYDDSRAILTNKDVLQQETPWQDIWRDDFWGTPLTHSGSHKSFRPLTILSFRVNRYFSGFNPWSYHLTNVLLHTLTTFLFVRVARVVFRLSDHLVFHYPDQDSLTSSPAGNIALLVSALSFASHPIHTEAVAGVVGRADVGATAFALFSFLAYDSHIKVRNRRNQQRIYQSDTAISAIFNISRSSFYFVISVIFAAAGMLCKEHGIMVLAVCGVYDIIVSLLRRRRSKVKPTSLSLRELECCSSILLLGLFAVALIKLRLSVMEGLAPPRFAKADNPTAHDPSWLVRTLTFLFLPIFNLSLLIYPHPLSYDWSMESVQKVESVSDPRNLLSLAFYSLLIRKVYQSCVTLWRVPSGMEEGSSSNITNGTLKPVVKTPCRACRFFITNHNCSNNNSIHLPNEADHCRVAAQPQIHHHHHQCQAIPSKCRSSIVPAGGSPKNGTNGFLKFPAPSSKDPWSISIQAGLVLLQLSLLVLPFLPATNLVMYVGFVVAERVLYFPSVGFCLCMGYGFSRVYAQCGRFRRGSSLAKAILMSVLISTIVMMSLGTIRRNEDWRDEGRLYRSGIPVNPPKSWGNLGNILNSQGRVAEAEEAYRQALKYRPNMAEVHYNLGLVLERQGKLEEALTSYRTAIHFRQQLASAYVNAGQLLARIGRINQAMEMYKKCFNLNDDGVKDLRTHVEAKVSALLRYGKLLIEIEDAPKAAVNVYRQAVKIMPPDYEHKQSVYNAIGEALFRVGEIAEAESWFLEALKTKPDHVPAHLTYGKMLARNKTRLLEAERWFRRAKKIAPQDSSVYHHYGQFLAVQGRHAEAASAYVTAASLSPNDYDIVVGAANALRQSGNNKEAEVYYEKAVALRSQEARAHMNLGAILHVNGKYHEAEQSYLMALRLKPSDDVTLLNLKKLRQLQARRNQFATSCKNKQKQPIPSQSQKPQKRERSS